MANYTKDVVIEIEDLDLDTRACIQEAVERLVRALSHNGASVNKAEAYRTQLAKEAKR